MSKRMAYVLNAEKMKEDHKSRKRSADGNDDGGDKPPKRRKQGGEEKRAPAAIRVSALSA